MLSWRWVWAEPGPDTRRSRKKRAARTCHGPAPSRSSLSGADTRFPDLLLDACTVNELALLSELGRPRKGPSLDPRHAHQLASRARRTTKARCRFDGRHAPGRDREPARR